MKKYFNKNAFLYSIIFSLSIGSISVAMTEVETETAAREPAAAVRTTDKAHLRQYPGGRDEQEIKVQSNLPQPTKNIDGTATGEITQPDDHD